MAMIPVNMQGSKPAERFVPPAGEYYLEVVSCESATNKDGQGQRLSIKNRILMGPGTSTEFQGKMIYSSYNMDAKNRDYLRTFIDACGIWAIVEQNGGNVDSDWFIGKQYYCRVRINKDGYPNVSDERHPQSAAPHTQTMPQTAAQPGFLHPVAPMPQMQAGAPMQQFQQPQPQLPQQPQFQQPQQYASPPQQFQQGMPQQPQFQQPQPQPQFQQGFPLPQQGGNGQSMPNVPPPPQQFQAPPPPPGFAGQK